MIHKNRFFLIRNILLNHYLPNRLLGMRWLIAIPFVISLISYVAFQTYFSANQHHIKLNVWDILLGIFSNPFIVHHGFINIFVYLVSDIGLIEQLELQVLLRMPSRKEWFQVLLICVLLFTIFFMLLILLAALIIILPSTSWSLNWGDYIRIYMKQEGLNQIWLIISPLSTTALILVLMGMSCIFIAMVSVFVTTYTQRPILGFVCGVFLNYSAFIIAQSDFIWLQKIWLSNYMFLWSHSALTDSVWLNFLLSCFYWFLLNLASIIIFWKIAKKMDFMVKHDSD